MLMLRSTHERLMAEAAGRVEAYWQSVATRDQETIDSLTRQLGALWDDYHELSLKVADFADRTVPPKVKDVKQPLTIEAADANAAKRLKAAK